MKRLVVVGILGPLQRDPRHGADCAKHRPFTVHLDNSIIRSGRAAAQKGAA